MMVQTKNINPLKKSTGKQFNDWSIIDYHGKNDLFESSGIEESK